MPITEKVRREIEEQMNSKIASERRETGQKIADITHELRTYEQDIAAADKLIKQQQSDIRRLESENSYMLISYHITPHNNTSLMQLAHRISCALQSCRHVMCHMYEQIVD
jgi:septal ring factor EnvC (AmiA/AmiB activator)